MNEPFRRPSRRVVLTAGAGSLLAAGCGPASQEPEGSVDGAARAPDLTGPLRRLEREHAARVGVFAYNADTGRTLLHRADERFPMCSTFKPLAAAAVLDGRGEHGGLAEAGGIGELLAVRVRYSESDLEEYAPVTGKSRHLDDGMTLGELCAAAIRYSDNTAANLLLRELGGPAAVTRFCRSLGDEVTRLDREETELNSAEPWRKTDTTSPRAIGRTYMRLVLADTLRRPARRQLTEWMKANTTGGRSLRAGLPDGWTVAEKTGSGSYATNNDVGVAWAGRDHTPVVLSVLTTKKSVDAEPDYPLIAKTARLLAAAIV